MSKNKKVTSRKVASVAGKTLSDARASAVQRRLAGAALSQAVANRQTSGEMETVASNALDDPRSAERTKELAGAVLSQSNRERKR